MTHIDLVLVLLTTCVALQVLAARFAVPHPSLLVLGGAAIALVPGLPRPGLDPGVIFLIFVPPLLYRASVRAPLREFRRQCWPILQLSVPLVLVTMVAVALAAHELMPGFPWSTALVLGAIVSAPDAVAAMAVMHPLRVPPAAAAVLEGEGMFNDTTALIAYRMAVAAAVTGAFSLGEAAGDFAWSATLGVALGLLVGWGVLAIRRRVQDLPLVDNSISLLTPFAAYLPANALGASGVLAVVSAGLYVGRHRAKALSPATRIQADATWSLVSFILEGLAFILVGLDLPHLVLETGRYALGRWLGFSALITLVVILVRMAWLWPAGAYARRALPDRHQCFHSPRQIALVAWAGIRGAESVATALAIPHATASGAAFPERGLIIFATFGVVFATLVLQGFTLKPLVRLLGLDGDTEPAREEAHARQVLAMAGLSRLEELEGVDGGPPETVDDLRRRHHHRARRWAAREQQLGGEPIIPPHAGDVDDGFSEMPSLDHRRLRVAMIEAERQAAVRLSEDGVIGAIVLRRIERDLDLEAMLLQHSAGSDWETADSSRASVRKTTILG
jgi:CPA1 family monovalent cation:H+ antiporter